MRFKIFNRFKKNEPEQRICSAVVVAAGASTRMGSDKLMMEIGGEPVLLHTLQVLQQADCVDEIVVVTQSEKIVDVANLCHDYDIQKTAKIICGGATRSESVLAGLMEVREDANYVAIHDGARPLVTETVIAQAVEGAVNYRAAAPAISVKDTIKAVAADGTVGRTIDRSILRAVQTPQVFETDLIKGALVNAMQKGKTITDDCSAVELLGVPVYLTQGDEQNIKITTPLDISLAEAILEERKQSE
ncbi:MAG: 2-C-methyl-D-erythritol 4-phosphate cytidylyltransferase [Oscillospiraceae bacterium]